MFQLLYKYLVLYRNVNIPGVGRLTIEPAAATLDLHQKLIHPPVDKIHFSTKTTLADRKFYHFICRELDINEVDAVKQFQSFTEDLKAEIKQSESVTLPGIGTLTKGETGELQFESANVVNNYFPDANAASLVQPNQKTPDYNTNETVEAQPTNRLLPAEPEMEMEMGEERRDYWWVWALLLTGIGVAALYYYYNFMA